MTMDRFHLVINAGSQTHKFALFKGKKKLLQKTEKASSGSLKKLLHTKAFRDKLKKNHISKIGFRYVHGGAHFHKPTIYRTKLKKTLKQLDELAPLHNPQARTLVEESEKLLPEAEKVLVFDTAFHFGLPAVSRNYALPKSKKLSSPIRRYGFHGIACQSILHQLSRRGSRPRKFIVAHLGGGASVTAIKGGRSMDTTMGFTPLEGVIMATRSGSIDPGLLLYLQRKLKKSPLQMEQMLNEKSGLEAICGTSDMKELLKKKRKSLKHQLAFDMYCRSVSKAIVSMMVSIGGARMIVFSGGIGENAPQVRQEILKEVRAIRGPLSLTKGVVIAVNEAEEINRVLLNG